MTATRATAAAPRTAATTRDPFFDNAKFLLIVLVVLGHNWIPAIDHVPLAKAAYVLVYTFHVPAFALVCGIFSRGFDGRPEQVRKLVTTVLVPYLIFDALYALELAWLRHDTKPFDLASPIYVCWFLLALFLWRLTSPLWRAVRFPIVLALIVSLVAGITIRDDGFAISRAAQLLPWFVAGQVLGPERFAWLKDVRARIAGGAVMATAAVAAWFLAPSIDLSWLNRQQSAGELHVTVPQYLGVALLLDAVTAVLVLAALALVPARRSWLTGLGAATMYPYLLHGLVVRLLEHVGVHGALTGLGWIGVVAISALAVALALVLATPVVRRATGWAVEPRWLLAR
ncbi:MAG TPA: acyltransferase family protein [Amnibacterium sp.]